MTLLQGSVHFSTNEFNVFGFRNEPIGLFQKVMSYTNCDKIRIEKIGVPIFKGTSSKLSISRTPDQDFRCFYPCEIILCHIPVPARGKDKKTDSCTSTARRSVTYVCMYVLKLRLSVFMVFWKPFSCFQI